MKKGILLLGAVAFCATAYAQQEVGYVNANNPTVAAAWGWDAEANAFAKDKSAHEAGTLLAETENVVLKTTFTDDCSASGINKLSLKAYVVNGVEYSKVSNADDCFEGAVGNTNPAAITDLEMPVINKGWVLDYDVKADGWLTVFSAPSMNKNFYVVEGVMGDGQVSPNGVVAYELYLEGKDAIAGLEGTSFKIEIPADEDGYIDLNSADIDKYVDAGAIMWPYRILTGDAAATADSYGTWNGAAVFPVYEGCHYYVFATGSKITAGPYVWTKEKPTQLAFTKEIKDEEGNVTEVQVMNMIGEYDANLAVGAIEAADVDAPIYNALGVRVNADAKGLLIQNGKKFIRK